jgi:hypothetical protein
MNIPVVPFLVLVLVTAGPAACDKAEKEVHPIPKLSYTMDVAPVLEAHCIRCHLPGARGAVASGLLMDSYEAIMEGSRFGPVINPGSAMTSSLYIMISGEERLTVNMPHGSAPLSGDEIETIRLWIESGASES